MARNLEDQLAEIRAQSLLRSVREIGSAQGVVINLEGRQIVNFSSNDYLALAADPVLCEAAKKAIDAYGVGAGASRLVCGTLSPHMRLEQKLAEFKRTEAALAFSSGYATAVGTMGALLEEKDIVILDKLSHASLIDGARLSGATLRVFPHNNLGKLENLAQGATEMHPNSRVLIVTESVFSMDGDCAALEGIVKIKNRYGAMLLLDEAHAVGVLGDHGRGLADQLGLSDQVDIQMGTLSKALGVGGGYVCGSRVLIDLLLNKSRSFIYSTAPPPALAATAAASLDFLLSDAGEARRQSLWRNLKQFDEELGDALQRTGSPQSAIIPVIIGDEDAALAAAQSLREQGFFVPAIRYPTVARGSARLRITLSAGHSAEQISGLCVALSKLAVNIPSWG